MTETESSRLIAETLRLYNERTSTSTAQRRFEIHAETVVDCLARMLKEAMDTLTAIQYASGDDGTIARALAEIEKIAEEEA